MVGGFGGPAIFARDSNRQWTWTTTPTRSQSTLLWSTTSSDLPKVFIDGEAGTTGLQVRDRLGSRKDIELLSIPDDLRKDDETRKEMINKADVVILCKSLFTQGDLYRYAVE